MVELARDIALICLVPQVFILVLIPGVLIGGVIYGLRRLHPHVPPFFERLRAIFAMLHMRVEQFSAAVTAPLIAAHALAARVNAWKNYIMRELRS